MNQTTESIASMQARFHHALKPAVVSGTTINLSAKPPPEHVFDFADGWRLIASIEPGPAGMGVMVTGAHMLRRRMHTGEDLQELVDHFVQISGRPVSLADAMSQVVRPMLVSLVFPMEPTEAIGVVKAVMERNASDPGFEGVSATVGAQRVEPPKQKPNFDPAGDEPEIYDVSGGLIQRLDADPNLLHIVCMMERLGTALFTRKLELEHFKPGTRENDNFHMMLITWTELRWAIVSVPIRFRTTVDAVADDCGMRLADGFPHVVSNAGVERFPMRSNNVWTLENKQASMIYEGPSARDMMKTIVRSKIKDLERTHYAWFNEQAEFYHRGRMWKRLKDNQVPIGSTDVMETRHSGRAIAWYTTEPRPDPKWSPYPK